MKKKKKKKNIDLYTLHTMMILYAHSSMSRLSSSSNKGFELWVKLVVEIGTWGVNIIETSLYKNSKLDRVIALIDWSKSSVYFSPVNLGPGSVELGTMFGMILVEFIILNVITYSLIRGRHYHGRHHSLGALKHF